MYTDTITLERNKFNVTSKIDINTNKNNNIVERK